MAQDPSRPRLARRVRGALSVADHKVGGAAAEVRDVAFHAGTGRVVALRVRRSDEADGCIGALFATPTRDGRVRVPPAHGRGWLADDPAGPPGVRWLSDLPGRAVLACTGEPLGHVAAIVLRHLEQRVVDIVLDDGRRCPVSEVAFLRDGRLVLEADVLVAGELQTWLALQEDHAEAALWWQDGALQAPPPLTAPRTAAAL